MLGILADSFMVATGFDGLPPRAGPGRNLRSGRSPEGRRRTPPAFGAAKPGWPPAAAQGASKKP